MDYPEDRTYFTKFSIGQEVFVISKNRLVKTFICAIKIEQTAKLHTNGINPGWIESSVASFKYHTRYIGLTPINEIYESIEEASQQIIKNVADSIEAEVEGKEI